MCGEGAVRGEGGCAWQGGATWKGGVHAGEMATEAGGTHPTGMHSCSS